jgi:thiosulfate/3-mercaptopyruvate sulfurtransferase
MAAEFGPLVTGGWLAANADRVRIVDVRWYLGGPSGADAYAAGHLPGAVFLDVDTELSNPATPADGRHPLPDPERFANALGRVGIAPGTPVVAYDDAGASIASRLWWMLRALGEPVAVLDGGIAAWPGELTTEVPAFETVERAPVRWPSEYFRTADEVAALIESGAAVIVDGRAEHRYAAGDPAIDPRGGHIPAAISAPWMANVDADGKLLPADVLQARFGAITDRPVVAYCGSGVTACQDLLALTVAGADDLALYPGSWSQWGGDPARPAEIS